MDVDGDQGTEHTASQFGKLTAHDGRQGIQVLQHKRKEAGIMNTSFTNACSAKST